MSCEVNAVCVILRITLPGHNLELKKKVIKISTGIYLQGINLICLYDVTFSLAVIASLTLTDWI